MKNKISKILGVGLALAMLTSLMAVGVPASGAADPDPLTWGPVAGTPSMETTINTIVPGSDVNDIAVSGTTIYAVSTGLNIVFKSTNGGTTWSRLNATGLGTLAAPAMVFVASNDPNLVVVIGDVFSAYLSNDGGVTFNKLSGHSMTSITNAAFSPVSAGVRYLALCGTSSSSAMPGGIDIQYVNIGALVTTWISAFGGVGSDWDPATITATATSINAVAFSPNFAGDRVIVAVAGTSDNKTTFEMGSFSSKKWNTNAGFTGYPVTITSAGKPASTLGASIVMSPTYVGADATSRIVFVGLNTTPGKGGLFRLTDTTVSNRTGTTTAYNITSIDYNGSDAVAGSTDGNVFLQTGAATASATPAPTTIYQRPGGLNNTNAIVAWYGANVVCGTSGTSSAFALSKDKGITFNDISLIDTTITNIRDVVVAGNATALYMISDDGAATSVWRRSGTTWERVLDPPYSAGYIVRIAPEDAKYVYIADTGSFNMFFSDDSGEKNWLLRAVGTTTFPVDLAVESAQVSYVLTASGAVSKSINSGFVWDTAVATGLGTGATITSVKKDQLLVGSTAGEVAWSVDGNAAAATWVAKVGADAPFTFGNVQLLADNLTNGLIYAASSAAGQDVFRWKVGTSAVWADIISGTITGSATGMVMSSGILYVVSTDGAGNSVLTRTITPTTADLNTIWSAYNATGKNFDRVPSALRASTGIKLWAIDDQATDVLDSFLDTVATVGPTLLSPADKASFTTNPVTGRSQEVPFSWSRLSLSTQYTIQIALDSKFQQLVVNFTFSPNPNTSDPVVSVIGPDVTAGGANAVYPFAPGTTYYWRVKSTQPEESPFSVVRSFGFSSLQTPFGIVSPAVGAANIGLTPILTWTAYTGSIWYEVTVSEDPSFAIPEWSHNVYNLFYGVTAEDGLKYSTTYYWRVRGVTAEPYVSGTKVITPAGPYSVGAFTTMAEPVAVETQTEEVIIVQPSPTVIEVPVTTVVQQPIPSWMLVTIIVIGAILVIALIILIVRTRRAA